MVAPTNQQNAFAVNTPFIPKIGPKALPLTFDFSAAPSYTLDFVGVIQQNKIDRIQTLFLDNSANTAGNLSVTFADTGQTVICPPGWQMYVPVLTSATPRITVSSTGTGKAQVWALNFPEPPGAWPTTQTTPLFNGAGALVVSDAALDAVTNTSGVQVINRVVGSGDVVYNEFKSQNTIQGVTQSGVASLLVGNPGLFVNYIDVYITGDAALGASTFNGTSYNPADTSGGTLTNSNLSFSMGTQNSPVGVLSSFTATSGKIYTETTFTFTNATQISNMGAGLANLSQVNNTHINQPFAAGIRPVDGAILVAGASVGTTGGAFTTGQVAGIAIDFANKLLWVRNGAGNYNNAATANPSTGVGGISFASITPTPSTGYALAGFAGSATGNPTGASLTTNFGSSAFANAAPAGFTGAGVQVGGNQAVTVAITEGTNTIAQGVAFVGASLTGSTAGPSPNVQLIKLDQLNYDAKTTGTTLGLSFKYGGSTQTLASGAIVYNIGAGQTATVN